MPLEVDVELRLGLVLGGRAFDGPKTASRMILGELFGDQTIDPEVILRAVDIQIQAVAENSDRD